MPSRSVRPSPRSPVSATPSPAGAGFGQLVEKVESCGMLLLEATGYIASWNAGAVAIFGYSADEIVGRHVSVLYPPEETAGGKRAFELSQVMALGRWSGRQRLARRDGSPFWAQTELIALPGGMFGQLIRDVSDQKLADRQLAELAKSPRD